MIPVLTPPHDDELFISLIQRIAALNGCSMQNFVGRFLSGETNSHKVSHVHWNNDGWGLFHLFLDNVSDKIAVINNCSMYPYQALFLTPNRQAMTVDTLFNTIHAKKPLKYVSLISDLYYCPECKKEEIRTYGHHYLHRSHQLPGVTVCHKHHVPLVHINTDAPVTTTEDAVEYAEFSSELLQMNLMTDIDQIQKIVMERTNDIPPSLKKGFFSSKYNTAPDVIRLLIRIFRTVDDFASSLTFDKNTVVKFVDAAVDDYLVYQPVHMNLIEMKHKCGTEFFNTMKGFLSGWKCPSCMQKAEIKTPSSFEQQVKNLVGDEYTVVSEYRGMNFPVEIRHNVCGHVQTYLAKHFLNGSRCPECTKIVATNIFPMLVDYMTNGQYKVVRQRGHNLWEVVEVGGSIIEVTIPQFFQEIFRPTPSDILPVPVKILQTDWESNLWNWKHRPVRISKKDLYSRICSLYKPDELIFVEDLKKHFDKNYHIVLKSGIISLYKAGKLFRVETGIYMLTRNRIKPERRIREKYLIRNGKRIGIYDSLSLAYKMGLSTEKPKKLFIMTNVEPQTHGRNRTVNGIPVHLRGNKILITEENYRYIMVLEMIKYCWHYNSDGKYRILQFIRDNNLKIEPFLTLLPVYSSNVKNLFRKLWVLL